MTAREVVTLNESTPQLEVPQSGDTYEMPRDVNITGNLTTTGLDINATGERLELNDADIVLGSATSMSDYLIKRSIIDGGFTITGGNSPSNGLQLVLSGGSGFPVSSLFIRSDGADVLTYLSTTDRWDFQDKTVEWSLTTEDQPFFDFVATADGDATSAISTLTTSGGTTHHIQVEINGVKAWIAVSTTNPS